MYKVNSLPQPRGGCGSQQGWANSSAETATQVNKAKMWSPAFQSGSLHSRSPAWPIEAEGGGCGEARRGEDMIGEGRGGEKRRGKERR
jgi:hypothetical protein